MKLCAECGSWLISLMWSSFRNRWGRDVEIWRCRECGASWEETKEASK